MVDDLLEPRHVRMPELATGTWLNTPQPLSKRLLLGAVVLIDFWDYTCVNCLRTLPYLKKWHERYANLGLRIVGIHSPEFGFGRDIETVQAAVTDLEIPYPILLDNSYENWDRFANKAWPTKYLADSDGYLRYRRQGEGYYRETEAGIQRLLVDLNPKVVLPELLRPIRAEDSPGAVCYRATPELFTGYQMGGLRGHALGNAGGYDQGQSNFYHLPPVEERVAGQFYLDGQWLALPESIALAPGPIGTVVLQYQAVTVNAVVGRAVEEAVPDKGEQLIEVYQDGRSLTAENAGADVLLETDGRSVVAVARTGMVELVRNSGFESHELTLVVTGQGTHLYSFSFTSCTVGDDPLASVETFSMG